MRISLNLYKTPVRTQNSAFKGQNTSLSSSLDTKSNAEFFYTRSGIRPATLPYDWTGVDLAKMKKVRRLASPATTDSNGRAKRTKVVNKRAYPPKMKFDPRKPMKVEVALKTFKSPNDMQDYYTAVYDARKKRAESIPEIQYYSVESDPYLSELAAFADCKVNAQLLGPDVAEELEDDEREQVRLGALFAYWSTRYDGDSTRYGYRRPAYIRTPHEFITSLCNQYPWSAPTEFERFMSRRPKDLKAEEDARRARFERLLKEDWDRYSSLPFLKRIPEPYPTRKLTFLEKEQMRVEAAYNAWAKEEEAERQELANQAKTEMEVRLTGSLL